MAELIAKEIARLEADVAASASAGAAESDAAIAKPLSIVVFGATGDLAREKLYPSFQQLMLKGLLPYGSTIMAYGRSAVEMDAFCAKQLVKVKFSSDGEEAKFKASLDYFQVGEGGAVVLGRHPIRQWVGVGGQGGCHP
jgi:glucose-6-phosphate 1-dehydrogenase